MPSFVIDEIHVGDIVSGEVVLRDAAYGEEPVYTPPYFPEPEAPSVRCPKDVRACPDGSYVGRTGPMCEFTPCPEM